MEGRPLRARAYLVATGAQPAVPDLPGLDALDYLTSTTAMELVELPDSPVVIGGGYVGMEQAQLVAHLGAQVSVVGRLAPRAEPELAAALAQVFADDGITVAPEHATAVSKDADGVVVTTATGRRLRGQRFLVAAGRSPRTDGLDLSADGVDVDDAGSVVVAGEVATDGVPLGDGTTVGVGDVVVTRLNHRALATGRGWVKNGDDWVVTDIHGDGSLQVIRASGGGAAVLPR